MVPRVLQSWVAPRRVVRGLSAMPEGTKLAVLMAAMLAVMFMMPVLAYAMAAVAAGLSRLTPWRLTPEDSRLALFWALLAVAPAMLLAGLVAGLVGQGPGLTLARAVCGLGFLMIWGAGISALARRV